MPDPVGILGFDASHLNPSINWATVATTNRQFCIIKATEGAEGDEGFTDSKFLIRCSRAKETGRILGSYDFYRPELDPVQEAKRFTDIVLTPGLEFPESMVFTLPDQSQINLPSLWLDVENSTRALVPGDAGSILNCWSSIEAQANRDCGFYGSWSVLQMLALSFSGANPALWLAHYAGGAIGRIPAPWDRVDILQYDEHGHVDGISGEVDLDVLLAGAGAAPTPVTGPTGS